MNVFLLPWAGFNFLVGLVLSLPLGAVYIKTKMISSTIKMINIGGKQ